MATCSSADSVLEAASLIKSNGTKLDVFVNGTASQTVQLGTGDPTPTLRKFVADAQDVVTQAALDAGQTVLDDVAQNTQDIAALQSGKADKVSGATSGHLAGLDSSGNLTDSGIAASIVATEADLERGRHARGMDRIVQAGLDARAAVSRVRTQIQVFDEACARDRLQKRLFSGTNPAASSKPVLFVICGQSNAVGGGEYGPYDHAEDYGQFWSWRDGSDILKPIADPIGKSPNTGSQWPQFASRFYALTGRKVILLNIASGASSVVDNGAANNWSDAPTAELRPWAEGVWASFSAAVPSSGYDFGAILWSQGEAESAWFAAGRLADADYTDALSDVLEWLRTLVGVPDAPVLNCMIGCNVSSLTNDTLKYGYEHMQSIQQSFFNSSNGLYNICSMPPRFAHVWDEFMYGVIHYGPIGYQIVGDAFARAAAHYISL